MPNAIYLADEGTVSIKSIITSITNTLNPTLERSFNSLSYSSLFSQCVVLLKDKSPARHTLLWSFILNKLLSKFNHILETGTTVSGARATNTVSDKSNAHYEYEEALNRIFERVEGYLNDVNFVLIKHCAEYYKNIILLFNQLSGEFNRLEKANQLFLQALDRHIDVDHYKRFTPLIPIIEKNRYELSLNRRDRKTNNFIYEQVLGHVVDFKDFEFSMYSKDDEGKESLYDDIIEYYYYRSINLFLETKFEKSYNSFLKLIKILAINSRFRITKIGTETTFDDQFLTEDQASHLNLASLGRGRINSKLTGSRARHQGKPRHKVASIGGLDVAIDDDLVGEGAGASQIKFVSKIKSSYFKAPDTLSKSQNLVGPRHNHIKHFKSLPFGASNRSSSKRLAKLINRQNLFIYCRELSAFFLLNNYLRTGNWDILETQYYCLKHGQKTTSDKDHESNSSNQRAGPEGHGNATAFTQYLLSLVTSVQSNRILLERSKAHQSDARKLQIEDLTSLLFQLIFSVLNRDLNRFLNILQDPDFTQYAKLGDNTRLLSILRGPLLRLFIKNFIAAKVSGSVKRLRLDHLIILLENPNLDFFEILTLEAADNVDGSPVWQLLLEGLSNEEVDKSQILRDFLINESSWIVEENVVLFETEEDPNAALKLLFEQEVRIADLTEEIEYVKTSVEWEEK